MSRFSKILFWVMALNFAPVTIGPSALAAEATKGDFTKADLYGDHALIRDFGAELNDGRAILSGLIPWKCADKILILNSGQSDMFRKSTEFAIERPVSDDTYGFRIIDLGDGRKCLNEERAKPCGAISCVDISFPPAQFANLKGSVLELKKSGNIRLYWVDSNSSRNWKKSDDFETALNYSTKADRDTETARSRAEQRQKDIALWKKQVAQCNGSVEELETAEQAAQRLVGIDPQKYQPDLDRVLSKLNAAHLEEMIAQVDPPTSLAELAGVRGQLAQWILEHRDDKDWSSQAEKIAAAEIRIAERYDEEGSDKEARLANVTLSHASKIPGLSGETKGAIEDQLSERSIEATAATCKANLRSFACQMALNTQNNRLQSDLRRKEKALTRACAGRRFGSERCTDAGDSYSTIATRYEEFLQMPNALMYQQSQDGGGQFAGGLPGGSRSPAMGNGMFVQNQFGRSQYGTMPQFMGQPGWMQNPNMLAQGGIMPQFMGIPGGQGFGGGYQGGGYQGGGYFGGGYQGGGYLGGGYQGGGLPGGSGPPMVGGYAGGGFPGRGLF
jgi:hypothetical protein